MASQSKDHLFSLIKSLDKAEKRNFRLYSQRIGSKENKFILLFDVLDQAPEFNEKSIRQQIPGLTASKLANLKRYLTIQIMKSLRLIYAEKEIDIRIHEQLDYAKILYAKGFYLESLKLLDKLKTTLRGANRDILLLETVEFQKMIELRHITRSRGVANKMENLIQESVDINEKVQHLSELATLNINIQGLYIKAGHVTNERDNFFTRNYFYSNLPNYNMKNIGFFEKVLVYQSFVWYHYMRLDFPYCYKNAKKWVDLFLSKPHMIELDASLYLRGLHYTLTCLFYLNGRKQFDHYFNHLLDFESKFSKDFSISTHLLHFTYATNARLNHNFLKEDYRANVDLEQFIDSTIQKSSFSIDIHRTMIFKYKIAWSYFLQEEFEEAKKRLADIILYSTAKLRSDTVCYTRVLQMLCYFECSEFHTIQGQLASLRKYLAANGEWNKVTNAVLSYINFASKNGEAFDESRLKRLEKQLEEAKADPYERKAFIYFNFLDWCRKKLASRK